MKYDKIKIIVSSKPKGFFFNSEIYLRKVWEEKCTCDPILVQNCESKKENEKCKFMKKKHETLGIQYKIFYYFALFYVCVVCLKHWAAGL